MIDLPLFDPISFVAVDPMHNIFLGTAKHVTALWIKLGILSQQNLELIQERTELLSFPYDIGRIPTKIGSTFSGFTADQWRTWTIVISPIVLKGILPTDDLKCWLLFVNACQLMMTRIISIDTVSRADGYLVLFCKTFQRLYGGGACTPNMHLHLHLRDSFLNYGPVHGFWAFPFEKFNGILGSYQTNNKNIEEQLMKKFIRHQATKRVSSKDELFSEEVCEALDFETRGSVQETEYEHTDTLNILKMSTTFDFTSLSFEVSKTSFIKPLPPMHEKVLSTLAADRLRKMYEQLYPNITITFFPLMYLHCKRVMIGKESLGPEVVMAYWPGTGSSLCNINRSACRVGIMKYFIKHTIKVASNKHLLSHVFCYITWKQTHPLSDWYGKSAIVSSTLNEVEDACCFMPVQRVAFRCASGKLDVDFGDMNESVFVASPVAIKFCC